MKKLGVDHRSALQGHYNEYQFHVPLHLSGDLEVAIDSMFRPILLFLKKVVSHLPHGYACKFQLKVKCTLQKFSFENDKVTRHTPWFVGDMQSVFTKSDVLKSFRRALEQCIARYDNFVSMGSGWSLEQVHLFALSTNTFKLFTGGCNHGKLPQSLKRYKAVIAPEVENQDQCLLYAVACALVAEKRKNVTRRCKLYKEIVNLMGVSSMSFPATLKDVQHLEKHLPLSIYVFGYDRELFPYYTSINRDKKDHKVIDLLYHHEHFFPITNLGKITNTKRVNRRKCHVCRKCLCTFVNKKRYKIHLQLCDSGGQRISLPEPGPGARLSFSDFHALLPVPFVAYCDLETCVQKESEDFVPKGKLLGERHHQAIACAVYLVCSLDDSLSLPPYIYVGQDCIEKMFDYLEYCLEHMRTVLINTNVPMTMTGQDWKLFKSAQCCFMCGRTFEWGGPFSKVRDHCHLTGAFRHALCSRCNWSRAKFKDNLHIFFHGLSNYDSHFVVQHLHKYKGCHIQIIPRNTERYLSFSFLNMTYKDTLQFMDESLRKVVDNLRKSGEENFFHVNKHCPNPRLRAYLYQKGIFPYNYLTNIDKLKETSLPHQSHFHDDINDCDVSDKDYAFAQEVWKEFRCKTFGDYLYIYLLADCLLLADCFENFRKRCIQSYQLDPAHYFSNPHFSFNAFLRFSDITFELLTDMNMYCLFNRGIRGGVSMLCTRYARANNKYMSDFNPDDPSSYLLYLDCGNLYGWCMMQSLPYKNFKWVPENEIDMEWIMNLEPDGPVGCVLEVDLSYPSELHDWHNDFPLAPHHKTVNFEGLSPVCQAMCERFESGKYRGTRKLMCTLENKQNYIVHYRAFQLYLRLGLKCTKVHRVITFDQAPIIRDYIQNNTRKRAQSQNKFDESYWKLMSNSIYGKCLERPDKRVNIKLHTTFDSFSNTVSKATLKSTKMLNSDLVSTESKHPNIMVKKPMFLGLVVLDLAKMRMYEFYYEVLKAYYNQPNRIKMLYTDTDSFVLKIYTEDVYKDLKEISTSLEPFDFYNYDPTHPLYSLDHKREPGTFKDELGGGILTEFVGLRAKMYAFKKISKDTNETNGMCIVDEIKTAKGVRRPIIAHELKFDQYVDCLRFGKRKEHKFSRIRSTSHRVATVHQKKITLSPMDDKRFVLDDMVHTLAHGHIRLSKISAVKIKKRLQRTQKHSLSVQKKCCFHKKTKKKSTTTKRSV